MGLASDLFSLRHRHALLLRALGAVGAYCAWIFVFRLIALSLVTYFVISAGRVTRFEDVSDAAAATELTVMGICALLFVVAIRAMNPLTRTSTREIIDPERLERAFVPGFAQGAVVATGVVLALLLSGVHRYLGFFVQFEGTAVALLTITLRISALLSLVYCEEFIFRRKVQPRLLDWMQGIPGLRRLDRSTRRGRLLQDLIIASATAALFCAVKLVQFDLGFMHLLTLFILSTALGVRALETGDFVRGAGYWAAILVVFHPLLSLPVLGSDFSGLILIKYSAGTAGLPDFDSDTMRFLSGGAGGPLSGFALQLILGFDLVRSILGRTRKTRVRKTPTANPIEAPGPRL